MPNLPNDLRLWHICGSMPKTDKTPWRKNVTAHVLAPTIGRAVVVAETRMPGIRITSANHKGQTPDIYVDDVMPPVLVDAEPDTTTTADEVPHA